MEYLEDVTEARYFAEEHQKNLEIGQELDPLGEQDDDECEYEGIIDHPDYPEIEISHMDEAKCQKIENTFKIMELEPLETLREKTRHLDYFQKKVIETGLKYARQVVKCTKSRNPIPEAPKVMVHGGAGSGKSTVINPLKQWVHRILQTSGDEPECPYVLVTAPTGTAAANVRGMTVHSAFGFNFGNEHYSLSDKKRDEKRSVLQNLRSVIIDEISMVKSDLLYQLDMRLREVTQRVDKVFGGVAIFAFGDLL